MSSKHLYFHLFFPDLDEANDALENTTADISDPLPKNLQIDDRVIIGGTKYGTLKYIGRTHIDEDIWCGIKLDHPLGKHDGQVAGKRYFTCQHRFGILAPLHRVEKVVFDTKDSRTFARQSIVSTDSYGQFLNTPSQESNLPEFSTSSNNMNLFSPRSPITTRPSNISANSTPTESLSSIQLSNFLDTIKEKDIVIENLKKESEKDRLELSHSIEKINKMKNHVTTLQEQYSIKQNENENLIREQVELRRCLEVLQFELEEYQHLESNTDDLKILDNYQLVSPDEIEDNEEKLSQIQADSKRLVYEKQIYQEESKQHDKIKEKEHQTSKFINELKRQIELFKLQINELQNKGNNRFVYCHFVLYEFLSLEKKTAKQLNEQEVFYKQQIIKYQSKVDLITEQNEIV